MTAINLAAVFSSSFATAGTFYPRAGLVGSSIPVLELISAFFGADLRDLFGPLLGNLLAQFWELFFDTFLPHPV